MQILAIFGIIISIICIGNEHSYRRITMQMKMLWNWTVAQFANILSEKIYFIEIKHQITSLTYEWIRFYGNDIMSYVVSLAPPHCILELAPFIRRRLWGSPIYSLGLAICLQFTFCEMLSAL